MKGKRGIAPTHFSTAGIPAEDRHEAWAERGFPSIAAVFSSEPVGEFSTSAESVLLGGVVVSYTEGTARQLNRTAEKIAADRIDVLGIGIILEGEMQGWAGNRAFRAGAGDVLLLDTAQPSEVAISISRSIQLAVPRNLASEAGCDVAAMHGVVINASSAAMLVSHVRRVREALPYLSTDEGPRIARTMLDMLVLAVQTSAHAGRAGGASEVPTLAMRARSEIRENLGSPSLTIANLCRRLQISRSTLHRLFEGEGGVQAWIRNSRLEAARLVLLDPENRERIGEIAERLGFSDSAHLSRLFRARYGETPSACRERAGAWVPADAL